MNQNYLWITTFGFIILLLGTAGLIWGYMLSIVRIRILISRFRHKLGFRGKLFYWLMNSFFWVTFLVVIMAYYFFIIWYVMNPEAVKKQSLIPSYIKIN